MPVLRMAFLLSGLVCPVFTLVAQGQASTPNQPGARQVVLDVVVTDGRGHPVVGLKESDFTLSEDGVPQVLTGFVEHDATIPLSDLRQTSALPQNTFRVHSPVIGNGAVTVILLSYLSPRDSRYVREQLIDYLNSAEPNMPMAILNSTPKGLHLIQPLTTDRQLLIEAASSKQLLSAMSETRSESREAIHGRLQLTNYLAAIPSRVNLILFTSGGEGSLSLGTSTFLRDMKSSVAALQISRIALYTMTSTDLDAENVRSSSSRRAPHPAPVRGNVAAGGSGTMMGGKTFVGNDNYKEHIAEVMNTGTHYYTLSYSPINQNWNGTHRQIHLDVRGYTPSAEWSVAKVFTDPDSTKVEYRRSYNVLDALRHQSDIPRRDSADVDTEPAQPPQHRLLTDPRRRGKPVNLSSPMMRAAMQFGSPTPVQLPFTVTVTPSPEVVEGEPGTAPPDSFLDPHFQGKPYRNYRIHYSIDPESLKFVKSPDGSLSDVLRFVAVLYTDDGFEVNSIATPGRTAGDAQEYEHMMKAPFSFDQTIAVPTEGFFFLRVGVHEFGSDHIGAIEIPIDALKPAVQNPSSDGGTDSH
jgi:VWFA-related protein